MHVLCIPCVLFIVKILYLENMRVDQLYRKNLRENTLIQVFQQKSKWLWFWFNIILFFNLSDHLAPIIKQEFKESTAAQKFSCSRTITAAIVNCLGDHYFDSIVKEMQELPFSIMLDACNDNGLAKMYPSTVRIFYMNYSRVMKKFLDVNLIEGASASTAATILSSVGKQFKKFHIP